jgi:hypothetical protein
MPEDDRKSLRSRFHFRCGYCGVHERDVGAELTIDHFQPRSKGGASEPQNWVYCCHACNEFKGAYCQPDSPYRVLHPHRDDIASHLVEEDDGILRALTDTGAFHIDRLHLNRELLVEYRRERRRQDALRQAEAIERDRLKTLLERVRKVIAKIRDFHSGERDPGPS